MTHPLELATLLAAIAVVESNNNDNAVGAAGERSRYQITPLVWRAYSHHTQRPENPADAYEVATRFFVRELIPAIVRHEKPLDLRHLAATWNYGPKAAWLPWPDSVVRYVESVETAYSNIIKERNENNSRTP